MLRCAASSSPVAERVRGAATRRCSTNLASSNARLLLHRHRQRRASGLTALLLDRGAGVAATTRVAPVSNGFCTAKRRLHHAQGVIGYGGSVGPVLFNRTTTTAVLPVSIHRPPPWSATTAAARRQLSTGRGGRPLPERVFAGLVVVVLAAWGLVFGAITLLLLPFVGIGLFLLRRNFQRGGMSRNLVARLAQKMAERGGSHGGGGVGGPVMGGGGGAPWMRRSPTEGVLSSLFARMLGGGLRGMHLVGVLRSEVERRALRHPGLSSALGGGVQDFSNIEISWTSGGGGGGGEGGGDRRGGEPSRVVKARLRFSGRSGGGGWAEVEVTESEGRQEEEEEEEEGMQFDRVFVTLDNGRTFDLTKDSFSGDDRLEKGASGVRSRGTVKGRSSSPKGSKKKARGEAGGEPVEAEFRDKK